MLPPGRPAHGPSRIAGTKRLLGTPNADVVAYLDHSEVGTHFDSSAIDLPRRSHDVVVRLTEEDQVAINGQLRLRRCKHLCGLFRQRVRVRNLLLLSRRAPEHHFMHEHVDALGIPNERFGIASVPGEDDRSAVNVNSVAERRTNRVGDVKSSDFHTTVLVYHTWLDLRR